MADPATPDAAETHGFVGQLIAGRYRVEELIGEGGMGAVYRATHVHMQKPVAVKVLHREMTLNDEARLRFEREAVACARVQHPHVTGATDFGKLPDGSCYLVLDFVSGESLAELIAKTGKLPVPRALHIVRQIASALDAAHSAGVVHRDLKPDNVMLVEHKGASDFVKVLDFGIAKLSSRNTGETVQLTQVGSVFGTPEYMSPEQAAGTPADGRADLYTIGIILFEMLSGETPFQGETIIAILTQHLTQDPPELPETIPKPLRRVVRKLLQKDPELRFQSAAELLQALNQLDTQDVPATIPAPPGPLSWRERSSNAVRYVKTRVLPRLRDAYVKSPLRPRVEAILQPRVERWAVLRPRVEAILHPRVERWAMTPVGVGPLQFPAWRAGAAGLLLGIVGAVAWWPSSPEEAETPAASSQPKSEATPKARTSSAPPKRNLDAARAGDPRELAALEQVPDHERSTQDWAALALGHFNAGKPVSSAAVIDRAVKKGANLSEEPQILALLRRLALRPDTFSSALGLLGSHFGSKGADVLDAIANKPPPAKEMGKEWKPELDRAIAAAAQHRSPALRIAQELAAAKGCKSFKELLSRATSEADERALPQLRRRVARTGCGFIGLSDCFPCLRGDDELSAAIEAASGRSAPEIPAALPSPVPPPQAAASSAPTP